MKIKNTFFGRAVSLLLVISFLFMNPYQARASLTDAVKPPSFKNAEELKSADVGISSASQIVPLTDPEKFLLTENLGSIREVFKGDKSKLVINIQDAHCNYEAQTNISRILDGLIKNYGLKLVALEGSTGAIDPTLFTTFPDEKIRREVADHFLKEGKICGAEYLAITSPRPPQLYGVETKEYYLQNLAAFTSTLKDRKELQAVCLSLNNALAALKPRIYSKELRELDEKYAEFKSKKNNLEKFLAYLKQAADSKKILMSEYPNACLLHGASLLEKTIDFTKVEQERAGLIEVLAKTLSPVEAQDLYARSVAFKNNDISAVEYHAFLRQTADTKKVGTGEYPSFVTYTDYLQIYAKINIGALTKEVDELVEKLKSRLFANDDQRTLDRLSANIKLLDHMFDISMSKADFDLYQDDKKNFSGAVFTEFIATQANKYRIAPDISPNTLLIDKYLPELENFYRVANARDEAILENTLKKMDDEKTPVVALITGGYHTDGMTQRLRGLGISYLVISPRITHEEKESPYLSVLSQSGAKFVNEAVRSNETSRAPVSGADSNHLAPTSLLAADPLASSAALIDFTIEAAVVSLAAAAYRYRQEHPASTTAEVTEAIDTERRAWLDQCGQTAASTRLREAIGSATFDMEGIALDAAGRFYIPVTVNGQIHYIRLYNAQNGAPQDVRVTGRAQAVKEDVGIQVLSEAQYVEALAATSAQTGTAAGNAASLSQGAVEAFTTAYDAWAASDGRDATMEVRVNKIARLFVTSMQGLRGSPDMWLPVFVRALSGDDALAGRVAASFGQFMGQFSRACAPQALANAAFRPDQLASILQETYSLPSFISLDLTSLLMTAVDLAGNNGEIKTDAQGRLFHTGASICAVGEMTGYQAAPEQGIALLKALTDKPGASKPIVFVKNEAGDREPNHFVEVESCDGGMVSYRNNGKLEEESVAQFQARWAGVVFVDRAAASGMGAEIENRSAVISGAGLKQITGSCGVIRTVGGGTSFANQLWSMIAVEYRGRDDEGFAWYDRHGVQIIKVKGYSEQLVRAIYEGQGKAVEEMIFCPNLAFHFTSPEAGRDLATRLRSGAAITAADAPDLEEAKTMVARDKLLRDEKLTEEEKALLYKKWRWLNSGEPAAQPSFYLLKNGMITARNQAQKEIGNVTHTTPQFKDVQMSMESWYDLNAPVVEGAERSVGIGVQSAGTDDNNRFSAVKYELTGSNIAEQAVKIQKAHRLDMTTIKYFLKFEIESAVRELAGRDANEDAVRAEIDRVTRIFERLADRVIRGEVLGASEAAQWSDVQKLFNDKKFAGRKKRFIMV
ncbi:MAG: hypothetical protein WCG78_06540, partial [Candidatus Omnitrophota bacterium]